MSNNSIRSFRELKTWQEGYSLVLLIYQLTKEFPKDEQFGITSQIRRAACSVVANIAEGFGRHYPKDKARFYYQARGSLIEVENFILISNGLNYVDEMTREQLLVSTSEAGKLINGLIRSTLHLTH